MYYINIETASLAEFANILLEYGTVWYGMPCRNGFVSDVSLNRVNINNYLPRELRGSDGRVHFESPTKGNLLDLLKEAEGGVITIHTHDREAYSFSIADGKVVFKEFEREED